VHIITYVRHFGVCFQRETYALIFRTHFTVIALYFHCAVCCTKITDKN